jgi:cytochrome P450
MREPPVIATYPPHFRHSPWSLRRASSDPLAFLADLARESGEMVSFSLAGRPALLLKHPDLVEAVLVTHHHDFTKSYGLQRAARLLGTGLLTAEGERHRQRKSAIQPAFHRQRLERYAEIMVAHAVRVRDRWQDKTVVDIASEAGALTLGIVGQALFGAEMESISVEVRDAVKAASDSLDPLISLLAPRRVGRQRQRLVGVIDSLIARHRAAGGNCENLISLLLDAQDEGADATTDQLRDDALTILLAGHDTIANALVWTWAILARHPVVEARLEREAETVLGSREAAAADMPALVFTRRVLAESMRLFPPAWVLARSARVDVDLGGARIPAGTTVLISQYLLHRDPRFFPDPATFDPDRWCEHRQGGRPKMAYIPFGAGPRACIGEGFAWMEGVLLLATFAKRWRFGLCDGEEPVWPRPKITLRPPSVVRMVLHERPARH